MKDNLLLYSHTRMIVESNNHSKNFLVSIMFSHYDKNNDGYLERDEIVEVSRSENIRKLSNGCNLEDMLSFEDNEDADDRLSINEFNQAFSKLYSLSVISLDKVLEKNYLSARVGDNVQIKCDITGSPAPPIIWKRNGIDLASLNDEDVSA
jgi:follistatin-related protein 5